MSSTFQQAKNNLSKKTKFSPTLQSAPLPDKAFEGGRLRVYAEWHPTSFLLLQDELVDDLCERKDDRQAAEISEQILILSLTPSNVI